ncbi:capsule assembly Wzi family protein [Pedobacter frigoris]|uniref:capsule assembly Wzi family protein n=1 Tax=Pedobacter frigoris TaxID=2571272 RepID=UPI00292CDA75|nr:capsule assembly Wzi family protein [Pedobacter frigoris]
MKLPFLLLLLVFSSPIFGQTLPVGILPDLEDAYRRQFLLGKDSSNSSFMIRPLTNNNYRFFEDNNSSLSEFRKLLWRNEQIKSSIYLLPAVFTQQYNSHHPYGINDAGMIPAKGYQLMASAGVYARIGPLSIQLRPEFVHAYNEYFMQTFEANNEAKLKTLLESYHSTIDAPERFGTGRYNELSWGQSSVRLNFDPVSIGVSNENLWWGPGVRNSLLMSNNAPGFKHITLNTTRPIKTWLGSFESQIIAGKLEGSGLKSTPGQKLKSSDWRYLSGIVFSYQPKWVPGLFLGFDRTFTTYSKIMGNSFSDYFPLFSALGKKSFENDDLTDNVENSFQRDQIFSLFAKWVMPESMSEIYFQFGREDHSWNLRDVFVEPEHSRAYIVGFNKLLPYKSKADEFIQVGIELSQLEPSGAKSVRNQGTWYSHGEVVHGYTNKGQIIGAGIGPDNMQSINVSWVKKFKAIGLLVERRVHNNALYYRAFGGTSEPRRHWADLGLGGKFNWDTRHFLINSQLVYTHSFNYQYRIDNIDPGYFWNYDKQDANNLHVKIGIMYKW